MAYLHSTITNKTKFTPMKNLLIKHKKGASTLFLWDMK